jgi:hypothetical protein
MAGEFFDPSLPGNLISGQFNSVKVVEPGNFGLSNLIVDPTKPFNIEVEWEFDGPLTPLWLAALGGSWVVTAYGEAKGPGSDLLLRQEPLDVSTAVVNGVKRTWKKSLTVPANTLQEENPGDPTKTGAYEIVVTVFLNSTLGAPGYDIIGFSHGPSIKAESPN